SRGRPRFGHHRILRPLPRRAPPARPLSSDTSFGASLGEGMRGSGGHPESRRRARQRSRDAAFGPVPGRGHAIVSVCSLPGAGFRRGAYSMTWTLRSVAAAASLLLLPTGASAGPGKAALGFILGIDVPGGANGLG